jgi:hypothetical protein
MDNPYPLVYVTYIRRFPAQIIFRSIVMQVRFYLALWAAKLSQPLLKLTGHNATDFPGQLALKICPDFLRHVAKPEKIIAVTGTNGKTTTNNILADVLADKGYRFLSNRLGSNIISGIATCLLGGVTAGNRPRYRLGVLEIDERSSLRIYPHVKPDWVVCTNLARDSCYRNAHPYYIFDIIDRALPDSSVMILNADDIISCRLKEGNPRIYYGMGPQPEDRDAPFNLVNDARVCPRCQAPLVYDRVRYNHIGRAHCPACGLASPEADLLLERIDRASGLLRVRQGDTEVGFPLLNDSVFHIYDQLAAITALRAFGLAADEIADSLSRTAITASRYTRETVCGVRMTSVMTKGWIAPACSAVFDYVRRQPGEKEVILLLEDPEENRRSSENITYLYDTDFEFLNRPEIRRIVVTGVRAGDFLLRLLLAGVPREKLYHAAETEEIPSLLALQPETEICLLYDLHQTEPSLQLRRQIREAIRKETTI